MSERLVVYHIFGPEVIQLNTKHYQVLRAQDLNYIVAKLSRIS